MWARQTKFTILFSGIPLIVFSYSRTPASVMENKWIHLCLMISGWSCSQTRTSVSPGAQWCERKSAEPEWGVHVPQCLAGGEHAGRGGRGAVDGSSRPGSKGSAEIRATSTFYGCYNPRRAWSQTVRVSLGHWWLEGVREWATEQKLCKKTGQK